MTGKRTNGILLDARRGDLYKAHLLRVTNVLKRRDNRFPRRPHALARGCFIVRRAIRRKEGTVNDKLAAAINAYAASQSKALDRVFDNIERTGSPSSADLAFCLPDGIIAELPEAERYTAFMRKLRFLGYAMWKSSCYRQTREHAAFETERASLLEHFPELDRRFREDVLEGHSVGMPTVQPGTPTEAISASVAQNGCTLLVLEAPDTIDESSSSRKSGRGRP